jgi:putative CocE/NonD family hydrolase
MRTIALSVAAGIAAAIWVPLVAAGPTPPLEPDIPAKYTPRGPAADFERRDVMIPMRDGVKLHTVIVVPRGARRAPIMLNRTPYNAARRSERSQSLAMAAVVANGDDVLAAAGYILAYQDIRGKYGSEGDYVMTRPLRGPLNDSKVDHSTDAYDTIDWLVKNVPEGNGRVGIMGSSYEGFTALMALVHPHPALKAAVPMNPMVDGWRGDDWFHNGAFRQVNIRYFVGQTGAKAEGKQFARSGTDDYEAFRRAGSVGSYAALYGVDQLPYWKKLTEHPAYDAYWQGQALDRILAKEPLTVPTMIVGSLWDQEDIYGAMAAYAAIEPKDARGDKCFLVLGPWPHSGMKTPVRAMGPLDFDGDTALAWRRDVLRPFLDAHLKEGAPAAATPPVWAYETGTNAWRRLTAWPPPCGKGCAGGARKLYLGPGGAAGFDPPPAKADEFDEFVSDPAKPVPYLPRPVRFDDHDAWQRWLVTDQRSVADRTDVLTYATAPLTAPVKIAGAPQVALFASTTGTDADWVVKLIDAYPEDVPARPDLGGYQLGVAMDIFRGRYRESLEHPTAIPANEVQRYRFALPHGNHVFLPGHRIMIQIQSSWFPLYDRNPQTFVDNVFLARPGDYRKATHRVYRRGAATSYIELPIAP